METKQYTTDAVQPAELIRQGGLVAVPTETVYGLAGDGLNTAAVERIYEVKGRPAVKPLSLMVADTEAIDRYCVDVPAAAYALAERFWPGPLTIVLKAKTDLVPELVRAGGETVGLRCPDHPLTLALLRECGRPLAVPSANPSGAPSPKTVGEVLSYFDGKIEAVIDGGPCGVGVESTIVDLSQKPYRILRAGALSEQQVFDVLVQNMTIVGITGGTGCGKTTLLEQLKDHGALVIDCDAVYHRLLEESIDLLAELDARFPGVVRSGTLQRKELGQIVFADAQALLDLNNITHRYVSQAVDRLLADWVRSGGTLAAIDAIALIESGIADSCSCTVGVVADTEVRIQRLMAREGISREYARLRIDAQKPNEFFKENCKYILENNGTREEFHAACEALIKELI